MELLQKNGYYERLIKEQLIKDKNTLINEENENINKNVIIEERVSNNLMINDMNDNKEDIEENEFIQINESNLINDKSYKISRKKLWKLLSDHKCDLFIGTFSGLLYGSVSPFVGIILGMTINILSLKDPDKIQSEGFIISMSFVISYF